MTFHNFNALEERVACLALFTLRALRTSWSLFTLRSLSTSIAFITLVTFVTLGTGITLITLGTISSIIDIKLCSVRHKEFIASINLVVILNCELVFYSCLESLKATLDLLHVILELIDSLLEFRCTADKHHRSRSKCIKDFFHNV